MSVFNGKNRKKGVALVWLAIMLVMLILFVGLVIDGSRLFLAAHQLHNAADAAALAGARIVRTYDPNDPCTPNARSEARRFAGLNGALGDSVFLDLNYDNDPAGDIVVGKWDFTNKVFTPTEDHPDALKAVTRCVKDGIHNNPVKLFFMPIVGIEDANVTRAAIAYAIGGWGAGIITLDCYADESLYIPDAATDVTVVGGGIQINSNHDDAFHVNQKAEFIPLPEVVNVNGGISKQFPDELLEVTNTGAPRMPDPLCPGAQCDGSVAGYCIPEPSFSPLRDPNTVRPAAGETRTLQPGYYPGGIKLLSSNETLLLEPGIYVLDGEGLYINGGNLIGDGVMLYITGTGKVDIQGNGTVQLNANAEYLESPYVGVTIYQDRDNHNDATINGTNTLDLNGVLYFPRNRVNITGTGDGFGTQLITGTLEISGHGLIEINYDGRNPFPANKAVIVY
jgi:Flp pilus assembly protein TadG